MNIKVHQTPTFLEEYLGVKKTLWLGALSFESRCSGSLAAAQVEHLQFSKGVALDYSTQVHPSSEDRELRDKHWEVLKSYTRLPKVVWTENNCTEGNYNIAIGNDVYLLAGDGRLMPIKKDQPPPDLFYFKPTLK